MIHSLGYAENLNFISLFVLQTSWLERRSQGFLLRTTVTIWLLSVHMKDGERLTEKDQPMNTAGEIFCLLKLCKPFILLESSLISY